MQHHEFRLFSHKTLDWFCKVGYNAFIDDDNYRQREEAHIHNTGFLGAGNIAFAVISGALSAKYMDKSAVSVFDANPVAYEKFTSLGVHISSSLDALIADNDVIFLSIKPQVYTEVLPLCRAALDKLGDVKRTFVTVAAGKTIDMVTKTLGGAAVIRVMPNTPLLIGCGATSICNSENVDAQALAHVHGMFAACGMAVALPESLMNVATAAGGSMPAFVYQFIRGAVTAAREHGMDETTARQLVAQTLVGAGEMVLHSDMPLSDMIAAVASPGGTTIAGMAALEANGFEALVGSAIDAATQRAAELAT